MIRRLVAFGTVLVGLASVLGLLGGLDWRLDLVSHFRTQCALALLGLVVAAAVGRWWRWAVVAGALLGAHGVALAPYGLASAPAASGPRLTLLQFNVLSQNQRRDEVGAWISGSGADVVFVQEVDPAWADALTRVPGYRVVAGLPRADNFGMAVLARDEFADVAVEETTLGPVPAVVARLQLAGRPLAVLGVHTLPPVSAAYAATRDEQLVKVAAWARGEAAPVVLGDLNATPFSAGMAPLAAVPGLRDSLRGRGWAAGTWPAWPWPLRIAIDHCWHTEALVVVDRVVGPELGSDHRPLLVSLAWADGSGGP